VEVPELGTSVFISPGSKVKNGDERQVVLNRVAKSVIDSVRGQHAEYVFPSEGELDALGLDEEELLGGGAVICTPALTRLACYDGLRRGAALN